MSEYERTTVSGNAKFEDLDHKGTLFDPDNTQTAPETPPADDEELAEQRLEDEADKLGSFFLARIRLGISLVTNEDEMSETTDRRPSRRTDRRGGRSLNEGSDSELDPHWQVQSAEPLSEEQKRRNNNAIAGIRASLPSAVDKAVDLYEREVASAPGSDDPDKVEDSAERALNVAMVKAAETKN